MKKYSSLLTHIASFQGTDLFTPEQYTTAWVIKFKNYLMLDEDAEDRLGVNDNTVSKYITALKTLFSQLKKKGFRIPADLTEVKVAETEQIVNILQKEELKKMEEKTFDNPTHNMIKDIFLFQCYTGARFSDIASIKRIDIRKEGEFNIWNFIAEKTGEEIVVPLIQKALDILEKYKNNATPLPRYTNQSVNKELKEIARITELNRTVKTVSYHDNQKTEKTFPLHKIISTHMARKTFISLSLQMGLPERFIKEISGHKDERSFRRYVNLNKSHLVAVSEAWELINGF